MLFRSVIAERQTAGRGQHGRSWQGSPGKSLHFSALLRPAETPALTATPIRVGLAVARALTGLLGIDIKLKWPNDVLLNGRKLGGILCESTTGRETFVVVGIGVNVGQDAADFDEDIRDRATSVAMAGLGVSRAAVAGALAGALTNLSARSALELSAEELSELAHVDALLGHDIEIDGTPAGVARGISPLGALLVEKNGSLTAISGGTVRAKHHAFSPRLRGNPSDQGLD